MPFPFRTDLDLVDIISAWLNLGASLGVLIAILRLYGAYRMKRWLLPVIGIGIFIIGLGLDLAKEYFQMPEAVYLMENICTALGIAIFSIGLLLSALRLIKLATTDALTGIYNKRRLEEVLVKELQRSQRNGLPLTLAFLDMDGLKMINDKQGHIAGDRILQRVAEKLKDKIRGSDLIARFGGDEFVIVMPHTDSAAAAGLLKRLQKAVGELRMVRPFKATISFGTAQYPAEGTTAHQLIDLASKRMYHNRRTKTKA